MNKVSLLAPVAFLNENINYLIHVDQILLMTRDEMDEMFPMEEFCQYSQRHINFITRIYKFYFLTISSDICSLLTVNLELSFVK